LRAGGGAENVLLVVNAQSEASKTVANHYIALRNIPAINVIEINNVNGSSKSDTIPSDEFRTKILGPVITAVGTRGIARQIDYIVYSSDFPTAIDFSADMRGRPRPLAKPEQPPTLSINSATYLWQFAMAKHPGIVSLGNNFFARGADGNFGQSHGFRSWYGWKQGGQRVEGGGLHYMLSTMLAVTNRQGTTVDEAVRYLTGSAGSDGTHPRGTIYYVRNSNVRSTTRHDRFATAVDELARLGVRAAIVEGAMPTRKQDVMGVTMGTDKFDWQQSGSRILPGAIGDNLTSFGGVMVPKSSQTRLTEYLRYGAAGACGTVVEPYAIQAKFPLPSIHVHYARGCSLAEAFYQSVSGPFQLLIVGDPLCRPWADIPAVRVTGLPAGGEVKGAITLGASAAFSRGAKAAQFQWFVDGKRVGRTKPGTPLRFDTRLLPDGYHELRVVAVADDAIETQGSKIVPISVSNHSMTISINASAKNKTVANQPLVVSAEAPGATSIVFLHRHRPVGTIAGEKGRVSIRLDELGLGPVAIEAIAVRQEDGKKVTAEPIRIEILGSRSS
jgi:hypothetical protein